MDSPFLGMVIAWPPNFAPRDWAYCQGQMLQLSQNQALFSLLGTTYGGNGQTTFGLPDLRGRVIVGQGQAPGGSTYHVGQTGGSETVTLTINQIPAHTHVARLDSLSVQPTYSTNNAARDTPQQGDVPAKVGIPADRGFDSQNAYGDNENTVNGAAAAVGGSVEIGSTGGSQPHDNRQPYQVLNWIIALNGIYPSRE